MIIVGWNLTWYNNKSLHRSGIVGVMGVNALLWYLYVRHANRRGDDLLLLAGSRTLSWRCQVT